MSSKHLDYWSERHQLLQWLVAIADHLRHLQDQVARRERSLPK